jgi:cation diffusion facilitator CzcD-associated flavoprotein CzcO
VFYGAATSHARTLAGRHVVVVGAGNSGGQAALHLARYATQVTIVTRGAALAETMSAYLVNEIEANSRIDVRPDTDVVDGGGDGHLEWLETTHRVTGQRSRLTASGLFVLIGTETRTDWLPPAIQRDDHGFVLTGTDIDRAQWARYPASAPIRRRYADRSVARGAVTDPPPFAHDDAQNDAASPTAPRPERPRRITLGRASASGPNVSL